MLFMTWVIWFISYILFILANSLLTTIYTYSYVELFLIVVMVSINEVGKKKASGSKNRKRAKENAQKNALLVSKMPKLQNYFFKLETGLYKNII